MIITVFFYYAAKYKSFSQAATILMSNQPNVTRAIHNLESQLGCRLFIRSNRGAELTPEGERLYSHVAIAYDHLHAAELELENEKKLEQGTVTIGVSEIALHLLLLPVLGEFRRKYPKNQTSHFELYSTTGDTDGSKRTFRFCGSIYTGRGEKAFKAIPLSFI